LPCLITKSAGKNLKPYQGLKLCAPHYLVWFRIGGVATLAGKNLKPYQGLKHWWPSLTFILRTAGKNLKPYQGLKRKCLPLGELALLCRKKPKTLSGIETLIKLERIHATTIAGKNLKPYQGLKLLGRRSPRTGDRAPEKT